MGWQLPTVLAALAEPTRLAAMELLWDGGEASVGELMDQLEAGQSRMSRHMRILKQADLVLDRRDAQWVRYRINPNLQPAVHQVVAAIMNAAKSEREQSAAFRQAG